MSDIHKELLLTNVFKLSMKSHRQDLRKILNENANVLTSILPHSGLHTEVIKVAAEF